MDSQTARDIAYSRHSGQRTRTGGLLVEHLERVVASVPEEAHALAYLHDLLEHTATSPDELELEPLELATLELLTCGPGESFEEHALRIAYAKGEAGRLARVVKLADIEDHLAQERGTLSSRPYKWARAHVSTCHARLDGERRLQSVA